MHRVPETLSGFMRLRKFEVNLPKRHTLTNAIIADDAKALS